MTEEQRGEHAKSWGAGEVGLYQRPCPMTVFCDGIFRNDGPDTRAKGQWSGPLVLGSGAHGERGGPVQGKRMIEFYSPTSPAFGRHSSNERGSLRLVRSHPA